jgi:hypothetical protein
MEQSYETKLQSNRTETQVRERYQRSSFKTSILSCYT